MQHKLKKQFTHVAKFETNENSLLEEKKATLLISLGEQTQPLNVEKKVSKLNARKFL